MSTQLDINSVNLFFCSILGFLPPDAVSFTLDWMQRMTYHAHSGDEERTRFLDHPLDH